MKLMVKIGVKLTYLTNPEKCEKILSQRRETQHDDSRKCTVPHKQDISQVVIIQDYFSQKSKKKKITIQS